MSRERALSKPIAYSPELNRIVIPARIEVSGSFLFNTMNGFIYTR